MGAHLRRRLPRAWTLALGLLAVASPSPAEGDAVHLACAQLSPDDAAQVEARTRATLLTGAAANLEVTIRCDLEQATVTAVAGERSESAVVGLPQENLRDALIDAVERALSALERQAAGNTGAFPAEASAKPSTLAPTPTSSAATPARAPSASAAPVTRARATPRPSMSFAAGVMGELWSGSTAYGGRVRGQATLGSWSFGLALGGLTGPVRASAFRPAEWHALGFASYDATELGGLRLSTGLGASLLAVSAEDGVVARSGTTLPAAFAVAGLARPFRFGHLGLTPALELRAFARSREVLLDRTEQLTLPVLAPGALVSVECRL